MRKSLLTDSIARLAPVKMGESMVGEGQPLSLTPIQYPALSSALIKKRINERLHSIAPAKLAYKARPTIVVMNTTRRWGLRYPTVQQVNKPVQNVKRVPIFDNLTAINTVNTNSHDCDLRGRGWMITLERAFPGHPSHHLVLLGNLILNRGTNVRETLLKCIEESLECLCPLLRGWSVINVGIS